LGIKDILKKTIEEKKHLKKTDGIGIILSEYLIDNEQVIVAQNATYKDGTTRYKKSCTFILTDKRFFFVPRTNNQPETVDLWHVVTRCNSNQIEMKRDTKPYLEVDFYDLKDQNRKVIHIFDIGTEETNKLLKDLNKILF